MSSTEKKTGNFGNRFRWFSLGAIGVIGCLVLASWAGHPMLGAHAFMFVATLFMGVHTEWKWRAKVWFWGVVLVVAGLDIALFLEIPWPENADLGRGKLKLVGILIALGNFIVFGSLFWITRRICEGKPLPAPILCRACQHEVTKTALRCPHCGEWKPGPLPAWPLLIVFGPIVVMWIVMAFTIDWNAPSEQPKAPAMDAYAPGQLVTDAMHHSVVRTLLRAKDFPCGTLTVRSQGGAQWIAQCDSHGTIKRYVVYPKTSIVRACPVSADEPCE